MARPTPIPEDERYGGRTTPTAGTPVGPMSGDSRKMLKTTKAAVTKTRQANVEALGRKPNPRGGTE